MAGISSIYVTVSGKEEAEKIAEAVLSERLAACANITDNVTSMYWWEGEVRKDAEAVIIFKTRSQLVEPASGKIKELHSYSCPCIVSFKAEHVNDNYAEWVEKETQAPQKRRSV